MRARYPVLLGVSVGARSLGCLGDAAGSGGRRRRRRARARETRSLLGSYLAGRVARGQNDTEAAAIYYRQALVRDPGNDVLIEQSFLMELDRGQLAARRGSWRASWSSCSRTHRTAHAFMGLADFKAQRYAAADEHFKAASGNPIGELTSTLARAWLYQAQDKTQEALALLDAPKQPRLGAVLPALSSRAARRRQAGRRAEARAAYERIPKNDQRTLRITLAYARHAANAGDAKLALSVLKAHFEQHQERRPSRCAGAAGADRGRRARRTCSSPRPTEGLAEAFYGLGEALTGEGGVSVGRRLPAVRALPDARLPVRSGRARQRLRDDQALRGRHRRLRPHPQGHAAADQHRHPQGAEPQPARARG